MVIPLLPDYPAEDFSFLCAAEPHDLACRSGTLVLATRLIAAVRRSALRRTGSGRGPRRIRITAGLGCVRWPGCSRPRTKNARPWRPRVFQSSVPPCDSSGCAQRSTARGAREVAQVQEGDQGDGTDPATPIATAVRAQYAAAELLDQAPAFTRPALIQKWVSTDKGDWGWAGPARSCRGLIASPVRKRRT